MAGPRKLDAAKTEEGVDPLTVSVGLGVTIPVGGEGANQYIKPTVEIRNIRLDQPVTPQVKRALTAAREAWLAIDMEMEVQITEMVSGATDQKTLHDTLAEVRAQITVMNKNVKAIVDEVRKHKVVLAEIENRLPAEGKRASGKK